MNIFLWVLQVALAAVFLMAGFTKGFTAPPELFTQIPWAVDTPLWVPRVAGISELVGAVGLILPAATRIKPWLTPTAAAALALVMGMAVVFHLARAEFVFLVGPLVLFLVSGFVAYARLKMAPITERTKAAA